MAQAMYMRRRFAHDGRSLEVRAAYYARMWHLGVFENGAPLTGEVARLTDHDVEFARRKQGVDLIEDSMQELQQSVERGRLRLPPGFAWS
ncbi:MAG TPA: hypothetical protein VFA23_17435 [Dongiaceae bacterium]|nr:hypothetical protein [Dongiaceae bacterium]